MSMPVVALGLDATDPGLLLRWIDAGLLPNCAKLRSQGSFGLVQNVRYYRTETSWITFLTGRLPEQTGEWGHVTYDPRTYRVEERTAYAFDGAAPFYARLPGRKVCVVDPPLAQPVAGVEGLQVLGWGTEVNQCLRVSRPPELMRELIERHGAHPLFESSVSQRTDDGDVLSYRIPSTYDVRALDELADRLCTGATRRGRILRDLLRRGPWDFFLAVFSETHTASHLLWHLSEAHPLHDALEPRPRDDPLLRVFQAVDRAIGEVVDLLPEPVHLSLFSIYGIGANVLDLPSMAFLPEVLYRWSFPGEHALAGAEFSAPPSSEPHAGHWKDAVWQLVSAAGRARLESPAAQEACGDPLAWQPANWFRPAWPRMKAYALPTYSEGLVRLNVVGRERDGVIAAADFRAACDEVCVLLRGLTDARSGRPMVRDILRTRDAAFERDRMGAPADLIVLWQEAAPTDCIDSPRVGRVGPLPYFRSGGHSSQGFVLSRGPGIAPATIAPEIAAQQLTAAYRDRLGDPART